MRCAITVKGQTREWVFFTNVNERYLGDWLADGLNIAEVVNTIPKWWVDIHLPVRLWCWLEDIWRK